MSSGLTIGSAIEVDNADLPGRWSVWSKAPDRPGAYFLAPANDEARDTGIKYAVVTAVMRAAAAKVAVHLIRVDPPPTAKPNQRRAR